MEDAVFVNARVEAEALQELGGVQEKAGPQPLALRQAQRCRLQGGQHASITRCSAIRRSVAFMFYSSAAMVTPCIIDKKTTIILIVQR